MFSDQAIPTVVLDNARRAQWRRAAESGQLAGLGRRLRRLGLTEQAVYQVFGVRSIVQAPWHARVMALQARAGQLPQALVVPPAALMAHLWVAGAQFARDLVARRLGDAFAPLCELGLLHLDGDRVASTVALLPVAESLCVSDRAELSSGRDIAQYPDDSALHTIGTLPVRLPRPTASWLDVGTGSGLAPLARPGLAARVLGTDINQRAIDMARLGVALSGVRHVHLEVADLLRGGSHGAPWDLITFNAPIPGGDAEIDDDAVGGDSGVSADIAMEDVPWYRYGEQDILTRFWTEVRDLVAPGSEVLVHSVLPDRRLPDHLSDLPGEVSIAQYSPTGMTPAFGMSAWRPGHRNVRRHQLVELTEAAPHVTRQALGFDDE